MTITSSSLQPSDHCAHLDESRADSSPCVIDFFAGRDCLLAEIDQATRKRSVELFDPLEDWLNSLISAAALVSVILAILCIGGIQDAAHPTARTKADLAHQIPLQ